MGDKPWKKEEREAATLFGGKRFRANTGDALDFEGKIAGFKFVGQVKHRRTYSIPALERLALDMEEHAIKEQAVGVVVYKRRAGRGEPTSRLVVMTDVMWVKVRAILEQMFERVELADDIMREEERAQ